MLDLARKVLRNDFRLTLVKHRSVAPRARSRLLCTENTRHSGLAGARLGVRAKPATTMRPAWLSRPEPAETIETRPRLGRPVAGRLLGGQHLHQDPGVIKIFQIEDGLGGGARNVVLQNSLRAGDELRDQVVVACT